MISKKRVQRYEKYSKIEIFLNKKFGISLHAYTKSLKNRINTKIPVFFSLH